MEVSAENDTIDFEIRINEGKIATMKGTGGGASVVGTSTKVTNNNSNTTVSNTSYVGNPDMGYKLAAGT